MGTLRKLLFGLFLLPVILVVRTGLAQSDQYRFSHLDANDGLSHNQIKSFFKDSQGFLWIGTISGLNRYDGYNVKIFRNDPRNPTSIVNDDINKMFQDPDGRMWISTWSGLDIYDPVTETFRHPPAETARQYKIPDGNLSDIQSDKKGNHWFVHISLGLYYHKAANKETYPIRFVAGDTTSISTDAVSAIQLDEDGNPWIVHRNGIIEHIDSKTLKVIYRDRSLYRLNSGESYDYRFTIDADHDLWIYLADTKKGIYLFNPRNKTIAHIHEKSAPLRLSSDIVRGVVLDNNNLIWIATDHGGINVIHKRKQSVTYILNNPQDPNSLIQNSINSIYRDDEGIIWAGTFKKGISYFHEKIIRFPLYRHNPNNPSSLPFDDINAFAEDEKGNIWIGTNGNGLIYFNRANNTFRSYVNDPGDPNSLSNNVIVSLCYDHDHKLWIGTYWGGLNCFDGQKFIRYRNDPKDPRSISDDSIWEIFEDSNNNLWVGTLTKGVDVFGPDRQKIASYRLNTTIPIHASYVPAFLEDNEKNIWVGTGYGVEVLRKGENRFKHYLSEESNPRSLINNSVLSMLQDSRGQIWIGTHGGLSLYDRKKDSFRAFTVEDGLPNNSILTIAEDANKNLWLGTSNGLSKMEIKQQPDDSISVTVVNYDEFDGLQGKQFNENAVLKTWRGELVFGGSGGFNLFDPASITADQMEPRVVLTDLEVLNRTIRIGEEQFGGTILDKSISLSDKIALKPQANVFSIEFAALTFYHPEKTIYRYKLEGFDNEWIQVDANHRRATYTNLDPGSYTFKVIASNDNAQWPGRGVELQIEVLPPFWRTKYALLLYVGLVLSGLLITRRIIQQRERMKFVIEQERREARRMHELDLMKMKFFTNVSHEFRTPLTLILTPIEKLLKADGDPVQKTQFELIHRNAKRLLNLVNQLLDFRKLEIQEIRFNPSEGDIVNFIKETVFSFSDLSEKKDVKLHFYSNMESYETLFDQDKLEKILFNLLSNGFKFTPEHGEISVRAEITPDHELLLKVQDTGIGIPADKLERIFDRFFQNDLPTSFVNQGSGIGLSITKEFVKAHGGTIVAESEVGKGSCFTVRIPVKDVLATERPLTKEEVSIPVPMSLSEEDALLPANEHQKQSLLIVEDNEDFRFYLKDNLRMHYQILEARDGQEAWETILLHLPDLVVSDVMMPRMNGLELCKMIKQDSRTSHTPVILLTARTAAEQKLEGFEIGADEYITKPFNFEILQSRIRNLIHKREVYQKDFQQRISVKASNVQVTSLDEKLIQKALKIVEERIGDADFSVEDLSHELGMSRVHLYKKLQALTGKAPLEFIRSIRLQHAAQLLEKSQLTVSEVAYKVGFNNPKYFAKYFKEEFNVLPSVYASHKRKDHS